mgnify:CR=1
MTILFLYFFRIRLLEANTCGLNNVSEAGVRCNKETSSRILIKPKLLA